MSKQLDPLPPSDDKDFWGEAEVHANLTPQEVHTRGPHYFVRVPGHAAQCTHCDWGFILDWGDKIKDGHLFDKQGKLVI